MGSYTGKIWSPAGPDRAQKPGRSSARDCAEPVMFKRQSGDRHSQRIRWLPRWFTITPQRHYPLRQPGVSSVGFLPPVNWGEFIKKNIFRPRQSRASLCPCPVTVKIARPNENTSMDHSNSLVLSSSSTADPCSRESVLSVLKESRKRHMEDVDKSFSAEQKSKRRPGNLNLGNPTLGGEFIAKRPSIHLFNMDQLSSPVLSSSSTADPCSRESVLKVLKESCKRDREDEDRSFSAEQKSKRRCSDSGESSHSALKPVLPNGPPSRLVLKPGNLNLGNPALGEESIMKRSRIHLISMDQLSSPVLSSSSTADPCSRESVLTVLKESCKRDREDEDRGFSAEQKSKRRRSDSGESSHSAFKPVLPNGPSRLVPKPGNLNLGNPTLGGEFIEQRPTIHLFNMDQLSSPVLSSSSTADLCSRESVLKVLKESCKRDREDEDRSFSAEQKSKRRCSDSGESSHSALKPVLPNGPPSRLVLKPENLNLGNPALGEESIMKRSRIHLIIMDQLSSSVLSSSSTADPCSRESVLTVLKESCKRDREDEDKNTSVEPKSKRRRSDSGESSHSAFKPVLPNGPSRLVPKPGNLNLGNSTLGKESITKRSRTSSISSGSGNAQKGTPGCSRNAIQSSYSSSLPLHQWKKLSAPRSPRSSPGSSRCQTSEGLPKRPREDNGPSPSSAASVQSNQASSVKAPDTSTLTPIPELPVTSSSTDSTGGGSRKRKIPLLCRNRSDPISDIIESELT